MNQNKSQPLLALCKAILGDKFNVTDDGIIEFGDVTIRADGDEMSIYRQGQKQFTFRGDIDDPTQPMVMLNAPYRVGPNTLLRRLDADLVVVPGNSIYHVRPSDIDPVTKLPMDGALARHDSVDFSTGEDVSEMIEIHGKIDGNGHVRRKDLEKDNKRKWKP